MFSSNLSSFYPTFHTAFKIVRSDVVLAISSEVVERIKELADVELIMDLLGFKITKRTSKELRASCILHGGDNPTAFRMRTDTKRFCCYTRQCHIENGETNNDIIALVMKAKDIGFLPAVEWLAEVAGVSTAEVEEDSEKLTELYRKRQVKRSVDLVNKLYKKDLPLVELSEEVLKRSLENKSDYFTTQGIEESIQNVFEIGFRVYPDNVPRVTIPIRDASGRLVGISGRRTDGKGEPRYQLTADFDKKRVLYNLHRAKKAVPFFGDSVILVEGFKAAWSVYAAGFPNVIACMGAYLLEEQAELLGEHLPTVSCFIMLDGDKAGHVGQQASIKTCSRFVKTIPIDLYNLFPEKSPDDLGAPVLSELLSSYL